MGVRTRRTARKSGPSSSDNTALKIKLRGKDNAPLSMHEMIECLMEAARLLRQYENGYRARSPTIYLPMIDEHGEPVRINEANELIIYPYRTAAEEHGV